MSKRIQMPYTEIMEVEKIEQEITLYLKKGGKFLSVLYIKEYT